MRPRAVAAHGVAVVAPGEEPGRPLLVEPSPRWTPSSSRTWHTESAMTVSSVTLHGASGSW